MEEPAEHREAWGGKRGLGGGERRGENTQRSASDGTARTVGGAAGPVAPGGWSKGRGSGLLVSMASNPARLAASPLRSAAAELKRIDEEEAAAAATAAAAESNCRRTTFSGGGGESKGGSEADAGSSRFNIGGQRVGEVEPVASASALASAVATSVQQSNARRDGRGGSIPAVGGPGGAFGDVFAESRRLVDYPQATGGGGQDAREWSGVGQQPYRATIAATGVTIGRGLLPPSPLQLRYAAGGGGGVAAAAATVAVATTTRTPSAPMSLYGPRMSGLGLTSTSVLSPGAARASNVSLRPQPSSQALPPYGNNNYGTGATSYLPDPIEGTSNSRLITSGGILLHGGAPTSLSASAPTRGAMHEYQMIAAAEAKAVQLMARSDAAVAARRATSGGGGGGGGLHDTQQTVPLSSRHSPPTRQARQQQARQISGAANTASGSGGGSSRPFGMDPHAISPFAPSPPAGLLSMSAPASRTAPMHRDRMLEGEATTATRAHAEAVEAEQALHEHLNGSYGYPRGAASVSARYSPPARQARQESRLMEVVVPAGAAPGDQVIVAVDDTVGGGDVGSGGGGRVRVEVPAGATPGTVMQVEVPVVGVPARTDAHSPAHHSPAHSLDGTNGGRVGTEERFAVEPVLGGRVDRSGAARAAATTPIASRTTPAASRYALPAAMASPVMAGERPVAVAVVTADGRIQPLERDDPSVMDTTYIFHHQAEEGALRSAAQARDAHSLSPVAAGRGGGDALYRGEEAVAAVDARALGHRETPREARGMRRPFSARLERSHASLQSSLLQGGTRGGSAGDGGGRESETSQGPSPHYTDAEALLEETPLARVVGMILSPVRETGETGETLDGGSYGGKSGGILGRVVAVAEEDERPLYRPAVPTMVISSKKATSTAAREQARPRGRRSGKEMPGGGPHAAIVYSPRGEEEVAGEEAATSRFSAALQDACSILPDTVALRRRLSVSASATRQGEEELMFEGGDDDIKGEGAGKPEDEVGDDAEEEEEDQEEEEDGEGGGEGESGGSGGKIKKTRKNGAKAGAKRGKKQSVKKKKEEKKKGKNQTGGGSSLAEQYRKGTAGSVGRPRSAQGRKGQTPTRGGRIPKRRHSVGSMGGLGSIGTKGVSSGAEGRAEGRRGKSASPGGKMKTKANDYDIHGRRVRKPLAEEDAEDAEDGEDDEEDEGGATDEEEESSHQAHRRDRRDRREGVGQIEQATSPPRRRVGASQRIASPVLSVSSDVSSQGEEGGGRGRRRVDPITLKHFSLPPSFPHHAGSLAGAELAATESRGALLTRSASAAMDERYAHRPVMATCYGDLL